MTEYDDEDVAMQPRCLHCLREQYTLNVLGVSLGEAGCSWCGQKSRKMTRTEYIEALRQARISGPAVDPY